MGSWVLPLLRDAAAKRYAIPAFNMFNLESAQAIVKAAESLRSPVFLQISQNASRYAGLRNLISIARALRADTSVPVILHFDHAESLAAAREALETGFDSVMLETAAKATEAVSMHQLHELRDAADDHAALLEAELEVVAKGERPGTGGYPAGSVVRFARESRCDLLSVNLGTKHKQARGSSRLDLARLQALVAVVPVPMVLHGGSSLSLEELSAAAHSGVVKINVATGLTRAFTAALLPIESADLDPRVYLHRARSAMQTAAQQIIAALGSGGRAGDP